MRTHHVIGCGLVAALVWIAGCDSTPTVTEPTSDSELAQLLGGGKEDLFGRCTSSTECGTKLCYKYSWTRDWSFSLPQKGRCVPQKLGRLTLCNADTDCASGDYCALTCSSGLCGGRCAPARPCTDCAADEKCFVAKHVQHTATGPKATFDGKCAQDSKVTWAEHDLCNDDSDCSQFRSMHVEVGCTEIGAAGTFFGQCQMLADPPLSSTGEPVECAVDEDCADRVQFFGDDHVCVDNYCLLKQRGCQSDAGCLPGDGCVFRISGQPLKLAGECMSLRSIGGTDGFCNWDADCAAGSHCEGMGAAGTHGGVCMSFDPLSGGR